MAQIRTGEQVLERPGYALIEPDSRVICVNVLTNLANGYVEYGITPVIANAVRLLSVDIWLYPMTFNDPAGMLIGLHQGTGTNLTAGVIINTWESVMVMVMGNKHRILWYGSRGHLCFDMRVAYTAARRQFAITIEQLSTVNFWALAAFRIEEG